MAALSSASSGLRHLFAAHAGDRTHDRERLVVEGLDRAQVEDLLTKLSNLRAQSFESRTFAALTLPELVVSVLASWRGESPIMLRVSLMRSFLSATRRLLHRAYLRRYLALTHTTLEEITRFLPIQRAAASALRREILQ